MKDRPASLEHKRLVIHNDDETPFAFAIKLLQDALGKTPEEARAIANKAHHDGSAECGTFPPAASTVAADVSPVQPTVWVTTRPDGVVQRGLALQWAF